MRDISLYFHWPFCASKCPYCDFNVHVADQVDEHRWLQAYLSSIRHYAKSLAGRRVVSVFFGGGTPSLMSPSMVKAMIDEIGNHWQVCDDVEITLEANPTSVEINKLEAFKRAGINRVSLGVQSLREDDLKFLGRGHDKSQAVTAINTASELFDKFSFDLIYARPNQTLPSWQEELAEAISLAKGHLSLYQLTVERKTPFYLAHARGEFYLPEEGLAADFYTQTHEQLNKAGLFAYETSNHAAAGHESRHNKVYWEYGDYVGIGPGAHGRVTSHNNAHYATRDHYAPDKWLEWVEEKGCGAHEYDLLDPWDQAAESLMMGLRLYKGIDISALSSLLAIDMNEYLNLQSINQLASEGWLCYENETLKVSVEGMLRLNSIVPYIINDRERVS